MAADTSVVLYDPRDTSPEVRTIAGFLAGYSGRTREAYSLDLRMFYRWSEEHQLALFEITRTHIELYARDLEAHGRAAATIGRRLSTLAGCYRYAAEEGVIEHSPAVHGAIDPHIVSKPSTSAYGRKPAAVLHEGAVSWTAKGPRLASRSQHGHPRA